MTEKAPKIFRGSKRLAYKEGFEDGVQAVEAKILPVHNEVVEILAALVHRNGGEVIIKAEELDDLRTNPRTMQSSIDPVSREFKVTFGQQDSGKK
jgi:hypothetical protein